MVCWEMLLMGQRKPCDTNGAAGRVVVGLYEGRQAGLTDMGPEEFLAWLLSQRKVADDKALGPLINGELERVQAAARAGVDVDVVEERWSGRFAAWWPCKQFTLWPDALRPPRITVGKLMVLRKLVAEGFRRIDLPQVPRAWCSVASGTTGFV